MATDKWTCSSCGAVVRMNVVPIVERPRGWECNACKGMVCGRGKSREGIRVIYNEAAMKKWASSIDGQAMSLRTGRTEMAEQQYQVTVERRKKNGSLRVLLEPEWLTAETAEQAKMLATLLAAETGADLTKSGVEVRIIAPFAR